MTTVYSILFQGKEKLDQVSVCTTITSETDKRIIVKNALNHIKNVRGDKNWIFKEISSVSVTPENQETPIMQFPDISLDKNFLIKVIVENKDKNLYAHSQKYLDKNCCKYIESKLYENRT
jgi:hypothetical protein